MLGSSAEPLLSRGVGVASVLPGQSHSQASAGITRAFVRAKKERQMPVRRVRVEGILFERLTWIF